MTLHRHLREHVLRVSLAVVAAIVLPGCPRELEIPDAAGPSCDEHADCNTGETCGALRACVLEHCEAEPSLLVPCDGGAMIDAFVPDAAADAF